MFYLQTESVTKTVIADGKVKETSIIVGIKISTEKLALSTVRVNFLGVIFVDQNFIGKRTAQML